MLDLYLIPKFFNWASLFHQINNSRNVREYLFPIIVSYYYFLFSYKIILHRYKKKTQSKKIKFIFITSQTNYHRFLYFGWTSAAQSLLRDV